MTDEREGPAATAFEKQPPVGLSPQGRAAWVERATRRAMIREIQGASWGTDLTRAQAAAFAEFMRHFKLDVSEIDNLGGKPYRNGRYYMRKIAELAAAGRIDWYKGEHLGPDARLDEFAEVYMDLLGRGEDEKAAKFQWAFDEKWRRIQECIRLGVPAEENGKTVEVVYRVQVKMKELDLPTEGVKWWAPERKKKARGAEYLADPVGDANPITSTETRAWRRVGRLCAAEIPELYQEEERMDFVAGKIAEAAAKEAEELLEGHQVEITPPAITAGPVKPIPVSHGYVEGPAEAGTDGRRYAAARTVVRGVDPAAVELARQSTARNPEHVHG